MFKVGDEVRILSGYFGDYNGFEAIITAVDGGGSYMVSNDPTLEEHENDDFNFHLCFFEHELELVK
jgi:hypothetical protein